MPPPDEPEASCPPLEAPLLLPPPPDEPVPPELVPPDPLLDVWPLLLPALPLLLLPFEPLDPPPPCVPPLPALSGPELPLQPQRVSARRRADRGKRNDGYERRSSCPHGRPIATRADPAQWTFGLSSWRIRA